MALDPEVITTMSKVVTGKCCSAMERLMLIFVQVDRHTYIHADVTLGKVPSFKNKLGHQCSGFLLR